MHVQNFDRPFLRTASVKTRLVTSIKSSALLQIKICLPMKRVGNVKLDFLWDAITDLAIQVLVNSILPLMFAVETQLPFR